MAGNTIRIAILANARDAVRGLNTVVRAVNKLDKATRAAGRNGLRDFSRQLDGLGKVAANTGKGLRTGGKTLGYNLMGSVARGVTAGARLVTKAIAGVLGKVSRIAGSVLRGGGKALGYSLMGFVAAGVTAGAFQVASALAAGMLAAAPAAGVLPGFALAAASAFGVLKVATSGLTDTLKLGLRSQLTGSKTDIEAYARAVRDLAPEARRLVRQMVALRPAVIGVRNAVAGAFLKGFTREVRALAATYLPLLAQHGAAVATSLNRAALSLARFLREGSTVSRVTGIFRNVERAINNVAAGLPNLVRGFMPLLTVSSLFLPALTRGFSKVTGQFAAFMAQAEKSGQLKAMIANGLGALKALFGLLRDVGGILKSVFVDANKGGSSLFGVIGNVIDQVDKFLNTAAGMDAIGSIWKVLGQIASALGDALKVVLPALGAALGAIAPAIGPLTKSMSGFLQTLAPLLPMAGKLAAAFGIQLARVFDILAPVFLAVGKVIGRLLAALLPVMPVVAKVAAVIGKALVMALDKLAPAIGPLVRSVSGFLETLAPLLPVAGRLAAAFGTQLARAFDILGPVFLDAGKVIGRLLAALLPVIPVIATVVAVVGKALVAAFNKLAPVIGPLVKALGEGLLTVVTALAPVLPVLAGVFAALVRAVTPLIKPIAGLVVVVGKALVAALVKLAPVIAPLVKALGEGLLTVVTALAPILPALAVVFAQLVTAVTPLIKPVTDLVAQFVTGGLLPVIVKLTPALTGLLAQLGPAMLTILDALGPALPIVTDAMLQLVPPVVALLVAVTPVIPKIAALAALLITKLMPILVTTPRAMKILTSNLRLLVGAVRWGIDIFPGLVKGVSDFVRGAVSLLDGWLNWMSALGGKIVNGLVNGLAAGWHLVTEYVDKAVALIPDSIQRILGIRSPSKVMADLGANIGKGLASGISTQVPAIRKVMGTVSDAVTNGVATKAAVKLRAAGRVDTAGTVAAAAGGIVINVNVAAGADPAEVGRKTVAAIEAWQARTGRRRLLPA